jgi:ferredoxin
MSLAEAGGILFRLRGRGGDILRACTRCGKCVTVCPMVEPADPTPAMRLASS